VLLNRSKACLQTSTGIINQQPKVVVLIISNFEALAVGVTFSKRSPTHSITGLPIERCYHFEEI
jgi:hypothetical protein